MKNIKLFFSVMMLQCFALLRAAYEGKTDTVIQMLDSGVPVNIANQVRSRSFEATRGQGQINGTFHMIEK